MQEQLAFAAGGVSHRFMPAASLATLPTRGFVPSIASEIGLGDFAYLRGMSGRRYVFSAKTADQASLYDNVVIALVDGAEISFHLEAPAKSCGETIFIHLLDDASDRGAGIRDLEEGSGAFQA